MKTIDKNGKKYHLFWDGPFSNWHHSRFKINNMEFNCGEQYMMYMKAMTFKDLDSADEIMETPSPAKQKKLGRQVKNYNNETWAKVRYDIVKEGLREKFNQNQELKDYLLKYKDYIIVEASPYDRIWGIGYGEGNAMKNMDDWGENLLGKIIMDLAKEFCQ